MRRSISGESPVNFHGSDELRYGAVWLSAVRFWKQKRWRLISSADPVVTDSEQSEPSAISSEAATQSSVSIGLTSVVRCAYTLRAGPSTWQARSWPWTARFTIGPPSSVFQRERHGTA